MYMSSLRVPFVSFRTKLVLAMALLVGGVSASTLYFARLALQRSYAEALQEQFRSQIEFFVERQNTRLAEIKALGARLAASEGLQAALKTGSAAEIYDAARTLMMGSTAASRGPDGPRELTAAGTAPIPDSTPAPGEGIARGRTLGPAPGGLEPGRGPGRGRGMGSLMAFLRIVDAQGNPVRPADSPFGGRAGGGPGMRSGRFDDLLSSLSGALTLSNAQEVAYLAPANDTEGRTFLEVVTTRVVDAATGRTLGAVVLGAPMFDGAQEMRDLSDILTGFWLDGQLHSYTIPASLRTALAGRLRAEAAGGMPAELDFRLTHDGETYRVFSRLLNPGSPFPHTYQVKLYSLAGALRTERRLQSIILLISLAVLAAGIAVSLLLANRLTLSVRELDAATSDVLGGDFQVRVPVRTRDDVGRLVSSFNQMTEGLAQKEKYRRLLNLVADARVASELMKADSPPAGATRVVTVLFCDVRTFTARTQGMPPNQVIELLNTHMTGLTRVVFEHHGFVDKFVGDLIMAVFGAPTNHEHDAANAVACARRMLEVRREMNRAAEHPLEVGIGLATGEVVAGLMGSEDRANYTVLGASVNLASRLCAEARPGQILLDDATRRQLAETVETRPLPPMNLKGFRESVSVWEIASA
jgi:class 3 adenylate cyclase